MSSLSLPSLFTPSPDLAAQILDTIASPDFTLRDIAVEANTTLEALVLWLDTPEIAQRLALFESAVARRTRLVATNALPYVAKTLTLIIEEHNREESRVPLNTASLKHLEQRRRARETARRAGYLLLRLAKFEAGSPRRAAAARTPSQREGAGGGFGTASHSVTIGTSNGHSPSPREGAGGRARSSPESRAASDPTYSDSPTSNFPVTIPLDQLFALFAAPRHQNGPGTESTEHRAAAESASGTPTATINTASNPSPIPLEIPEDPPSPIRVPVSNFSPPTIRHEPFL